MRYQFVYICLKTNTFCKKNEQNERKVRRNHQLCKQGLQSYSSIDYMKHLQLTIVRPKSSNLL